jgi:hypothetical protein
MRIQIDPQAVEFIRQKGGQVTVTAPKPARG